MNRFRQLCATTLLVVLLSTSPVLAGDMPGPGVTSSSPSSDASVTGNMPTGITLAIDPVTEFTLTLWQGVLSLF
jgi:hypothetical protein